MAKLNGVLSTNAAAGILVLVAACAGAPDTPSSPTPQPLGEGTVLTESVGADQSATPLPSWILEPSTLPSGRVGKNNCTFPFGQTVPQWDFHPDAGCWEHTGPDGWTRQQQQSIHIPQFPACGGGPGDATAIRVCRLGGADQPSPCLIDPLTGPAGCARCVINPTCH